MLIYQNHINEFVKDVRENVLSNKMQYNFVERFGHKPSKSEIRSWKNSSQYVRDLIEISEIKDAMIALEYDLPYSQSRIDYLLFGKGTDVNNNIVLIELKQWDMVQAIEPTEDEGNFVETYTGGGNRIVAHPSQQVKGYDSYLKNFINEFQEQPPLALFSCAYCHNYKKEDGKGLFDPMFSKILSEFPLYTEDDLKELGSKIKDLLNKGEGFEIFNRFMNSKIAPSKKLLDNVSKVISNEGSFALLNEQLVAKNLIWSKIRKAKKSKNKSIIIVHGGPGTGKSVIAVNVLAEAAHRGISVFYGCKSKPFSEGLRSKVGKDGKELFSNLYRFVPSKVKENEIDLLLIDEAHRVGNNSNHQYTKAEDRTDMPQMEQLIRSAKVSVFFIDDRQVVRSQEIGSTVLIKEFAAQFNCSVDEVTLETQFRCMGSNNYLEWVEAALGYSDSNKVLSKSEIFDFKIMNSPHDLYAFLEAREKEKPNSARLVAGFCWPWSKPNPDGTLVKDVVIGDFSMPWETKDGGKTLPGIPKWYEWAYKTKGVEQIGCIYTAQGFEFDYIGVIIGPDIKFDQKTGKLVGNIPGTADPMLKRSTQAFDSYVRNIYRVLLSRGMKGCYVYFVDKETRDHFESLIES
jgi:DUF2075 family protein